MIGFFSWAVSLGPPPKRISFHFTRNDKKCKQNFFYGGSKLIIFLLMVLIRVFLGLNIFACHCVSYERTVPGLMVVSAPSEIRRTANHRDILTLFLLHIMILQKFANLSYYSWKMLSRYLVLTPLKSDSHLPRQICYICFIKSS